MSAWTEMHDKDRLAAVLAVKAANPSWRYPAIAAALGTTRSAIGGVIYRAGLAKRTEALREIRAVDPLVRSVFSTIAASGISDMEIAKRSGYSVETLWSLRTGVRGSKLRTVQDFLQTVGARLAVVSDIEPPPIELPSLNAIREAVRA